jgi:CBS domain-containing protein
MFHVHGITGRVLTGSLEELRRHRAATAVGRTSGVGPVRADPEPTAPRSGDGRGVGRDAERAYGAPAKAPARRPLRLVADVMRSPALVVSADASTHEARGVLARHGIGQAPVVDARGELVGLVGRAELMPHDGAGRPPAAGRPVSEVMWTPVPATEPSTDLRRVAALLLDTGLPGVPVLDDAGRIVGFVSRTDLLRALATDPPLDLWA